MKPRPLLIVFCAGLLIATVAMVGRQRQQLNELRAQAQDLQSRSEALTNVSPEQVETSDAVVAAAHSDPSLELLRLRSQAGQLQRRKLELTGLVVENQKLKEQVAARATNALGIVALPKGYIRRAEAKFAGYGTPEDSLQSFMWAIEHRDLPALTQVVEPEQASQIAAQVERRGSEDEFFKEAGMIPGFRIMGRETKEDGSVELKVQIDPTDDVSIQKIKFKQFDGAWRLVSGI